MVAQRIKQNRNQKTELCAGPPVESWQGARIPARDLPQHKREQDIPKRAHQNGESQVECSDGQVRSGNLSRCQRVPGLFTPSVPVPGKDQTFVSEIDGFGGAG